MNQRAKHPLTIEEIDAVARKVYGDDPPPVTALSELLRQDYHIGCQGDAVEIDVPTFAMRCYHAKDLEREHRQMDEALRKIARWARQTDKGRLLDMCWGAMTKASRDQLREEGVGA